MNDQSSSPERQPAEPLIYLPTEWTVKSQTVKIDSLVVQHKIAPANRVPKHKTSYHCLAYELSPSTSKTTFIGDEHYVGDFQRGEFCLHPADYYASYGWESTDEIVLLALKPDFLSNIAEQSECLNPDRIELTPVLKDRDPILSQIVDSFLREMNTKGLGGRLYSETLATQFAIHLLRNYSISPLRLKHYSDGLSPSKLQMVIEYIEANLAHKIGLKDLAQIAQISPSYFLRLFKQSTGITPHQYVMQRRVKLGKRLLKQGKLPTVEIAMICGFANQSSFTRAFRKVVGITPKTYQKQI